MSHLFEDVKQYVDDMLKDHPKRLKHTQGVSDTAYELAGIHNENREMAKIAGYLHDVTKKWSEIEHLKLMSENDIALYQGFPFFYHGITASQIANQRFKIDDLDVLNSIYFHSTGRENMSKMEQIIFISDVCEPNRPWETETLFNIAKKDLNYATYLCAQIKYDDNIASNHLIHQNLEHTLTYYKEKLWTK